MAPIDAGIPLSVQMPHLLSPLEAQSQVGQVRQQQQQQALGQQQMGLNDAALQQHQLQVAAAQREANEEQALRGMFAQGTPTVKDLIPVVGPDRAVKIMTGLSALQEAAKAQARTDYTGSQTLIKDTLAGMDALPENLRAQTYPAVRNVLVTQGHIDPAQVPEQYDPAWWKQARGYGQAPAKNISLAPDATLVNDQTGAVVAKGAPAPGPDMKSYVDYVNGVAKTGGKPMDYQAFRVWDANLKAPRTTVVTGSDAPTPPPDPASMNILSQTGLNINAFRLLTGQASQLPRDAATRQKAARDAEVWARAHNVDISTLPAQYKAQNAVLERNIERLNNTKIMESELKGTVENLQTVLGDDPSGVRAMVALKAWLGQEVNDPNSQQYKFHLGQLQNELAAYYAAAAGRPGSGITVQDNKDAETTIKNGISKGGLTGLQKGVEDSTAKMGPIMQKSVDRAQQAVWGLFGVGQNYKNTSSSPSQQSAPAAGKIVVKAPDGSLHPFDTQAQADAFKKLAGIK